MAIARALLADPRILILDDATSSVDATTEAAIKTGLREAMAGRTTFIIAHRLSTVSLADEIIVLDHGAIVDRGTHEELMEGCGFYREIAEHGLADSVFLQPTSSSARRWRGCEAASTQDATEERAAGADADGRTRCATSRCSSARSGAWSAARISAAARCAG